ncbi:hypothetical protein Pcac1_g3488 [Phytophthora cactorum]|nr:hypothetical protein Pcac1_g3488 [Phytophthora cactorum]
MSRQVISSKLGKLLIRVNPSVISRTGVARLSSSANTSDARCERANLGGLHGGAAANLATMLDLG